jgi:RimJ/RimL family protein N-acetyltransferase
MTDFSKQGKWINYNVLSSSISIGSLEKWYQMWGQGYMSEALQPIIRYGFEDLDLNRLYAYHMVRNSGSGKVLQKNGFELEGVLRQRVRKWGVFEDVKLWAMLHGDWQNLEVDS